MIVLLSDDAEVDIAEGAAFYDQHGSEIGDRFCNSGGKTGTPTLFCTVGRTRSPPYGGAEIPSKGRLRRRKANRG
jgi:hypothetical protein